MAKESAEKFAMAVMEDSDLRVRTARLDPGELLPIAKELGYDCGDLQTFADTENEWFTSPNREQRWREARQELTPDELEATAGGLPPQRESDMHRREIENEMFAEIARHCHHDVSGPLHNWVVIAHEERWLFWKWSRGYDILKCSLCGEINERRV